MGLFSGLKKLVKGVIGGVKKIFKPVTKFIGKLTQKKWFKWLMIGATVFTAGVALYAGAQGFLAAGQAGQSLLGRFVTGGTEFLKALLSPVQTAQNIMSGQRTVGSLAQQFQSLNAAQGAADVAATTGISGNPADALTAAGEGVTTAPATGPDMSAFSEAAAGPSPAAQVGQAAGQAAGAAPPVAPAPTAPGPAHIGPGGEAVLPSVTPPGLEALPPAPGGGMWDSTRGFFRGVSDFAKTTGGGMLLGQMLQGYGAGKAEEEYWKRQDRVREEWRDPEAVAAVRAQAQRRIPVPQNMMRNAAAQPWNIRSHYRYPGTVAGPQPG